jgi:hypothetical protein
MPGSCRWNMSGPRPHLADARMRRAIVMRCTSEGPS